MKPEQTSEIGYARVVAPGMVTPGITNVIRSSPVGTIREGGWIELEELDSRDLRLSDPSEIDPGTTVKVVRRRGTEWCKPLAEYQRDQQASKAKRRAKERQRSQEKDRKRDEAAAFWDQYEIPFDHDVAIKGRLSGLVRGSDGTGTASNTVEHLYVHESFSEGRLERDEEQYLCNNSASFRFDEGERRKDSSGEGYVPKVTCKQCLNLMERWKVSEGSE